jgi:hypothetical protein
MPRDGRRGAGAEQEDGGEQAEQDASLHVLLERSRSEELASGC